jgi:hypothetical protein
LDKLSLILGLILSIVLKIVNEIKSIGSTTYVLTGAATIPFDGPRTDHHSLNAGAWPTRETLYSNFQRPPGPLFRLDFDYFLSAPDLCDFR